MFIRFRFTPVMLAACISNFCLAAPPLTRIRDTIYNASGTRFNGTVTIEWRSFDASDGSFIGKNRLRVDVVDGFLNVRLVPTTSALSSAYYSVKYVSNGIGQFTEAWAVPPSAETLRVTNVRIADPLLNPGGGAGDSVEVEIADVIGLQDELDLRPLKSPNFTSNRAVISSDSGELDVAIGNPEDCVRVDGSSGPCGTGSGGTGSVTVVTFVDGETPAGSVNGVNNTFTLAQTPVPYASLLLYRNGVLQRRTSDYTITGNSIQFLAGAIPQTGDTLVASYRTSGTTGVILCTGSGGSTSSTGSTSLGTCTIPANLLVAGERLDIRYDFSHTGTLTGFTYQALFGGTTLISRMASATTSVVTGFSNIGFYTGGGQWSGQSWGTNLLLEADIGTTSENLTVPVVIDFRASMASTTTESVTLRNFTVTRYPTP